MTTDLLDFTSEELYFDEPLQAQVRDYLERAAEDYGEGDAEPSLLRAYFLAPEHPMVLVAMYRYFYYQHRLTDALLVADRVLKVFAKRLDLPQDWHELTESQLGSGVMVSMTMIRFYLLALKGAGFLELRLGFYTDALERLRKVVELDAHDRLGAQALLKMAQQALDTQAGPALAKS
jgi:tetratricopeptide (TPR) repeat protein